MSNNPNLARPNIKKPVWREISRECAAVRMPTMWSLIAIATLQQRNDSGRKNRIHFRYRHGCQFEPLDDRFHETGIDEAMIDGTGSMLVDSSFGKC
jgi:hypothetical protein